MTELKRVLGLPMLTFYGVGMILGAGIYTIIGKAAGVAGTSVWISLIIAAIVATLAGLSYAELAAMFPKVGGEYIYLRNAFPKMKWVANTSGLMMAFAGITTASSVALAFSGYLQQFVSVSPFIIAFFLMLFFTLIGILGIEESSWMNILFTSIETSGLIIFIGLGVQMPEFTSALATTITTSTFSASALIIFAYFGFENIVNFAEEAKNPEKTIPRAVLLSIAISIVLYVLVALSAMALLPIADLAASDAPLSDAVRTVSPKLAGVLGGIALFATSNTVLISLVTTSRILLGMARDQSLPKAFTKISEKRKTPWFSAIITFIACCALLPLGEVEVIASISSFSTLIAFIAVHSALIVLRFTRPQLDRPFRIPFNIIKIPVFPVLGAIATFLLLFQFEREVYVVGGGFFLLLLVFQVLTSFVKSKLT